MTPPGYERIGTAAAGQRRPLLYAGLALGFVAVAATLVVLQGREIERAFADFPPWAAAGAVAAHFAWLCSRGEAWRISLNAIGPITVPRPSAHASNAIAFLVGVIQSAATVPARALTLRRLAPDRSPKLEPTLVADAPVLAMESTLMGIALLVAALITPGVPMWAVAVVLGGGVAVLVALFATREHFHDRGIAVGLRVLEDPRRRIKLVGLCLMMSALALTRSWLVLTGFGLPDGFASAALFVGALGVLGALPIGPTASPAAALAVFGASDSAAAAAAGFAMLSTSIVAIGLYGGVWLAVLALRGDEPMAALRGAPVTEARGADV